VMMPEQEEGKKLSVLVLGGTNFMGKALLDTLVPQNFRVCCINRGKIYWYIFLTPGTTRLESSIQKSNGFALTVATTKTTLQP
jgi:nucleoside-diphosphate-sugar epimerase